MAGAPLLTPLLLPDEGAFEATPDRKRLAQALAADPALGGRARCDSAGTIVLTGPSGGPPPASLKERQRCELHVRLRVEAELGPAAAGAKVRWAGSGECI